MDEEHKKDFDKWNEVKKDINSKLLPVEFFFLEGEIWWASLGVNVGEEIDGKHDNFERPILVLNKISENTLWALPITSSEIEGEYFYEINHKGNRNIICLSQIRFISAKRLLKFMYILNNNDFESIINKMIKYLKVDKRNPPL